MDIDFNGNHTLVLENQNLDAFLQEHNLLEKKGIAVAVNNVVIPKTSWADYQLKNMDKVLIIKASQGG